MDDEQKQEQQEQTEPIHTDAEAELTKQLTELKAELAKLREENKKLFLRLGGNGTTPKEKTPDDEIREMLKDFQQSGYDPSTLYGG